MDRVFEVVARLKERECALFLSWLPAELLGELARFLTSDLWDRKEITFHKLASVPSAIDCCAASAYGGSRLLVIYSATCRLAAFDLATKTDIVISSSSYVGASAIVSDSAIYVVTVRHVVHQCSWASLNSVRSLCVLARAKSAPSHASPRLSVVRGLTKRYLIVSSSQLIAALEPDSLTLARVLFSGSDRWNAPLAIAHNAVWAPVGNEVHAWNIDSLELQRVISLHAKLVPMQLYPRGSNAALALRKLPDDSYSVVQVANLETGLGQCELNPKQVTPVFSDKSSSPHIRLYFDIIASHADGQIVFDRYDEVRGQRERVGSIWFSEGWWILKECVITSNLVVAIFAQSFEVYTLGEVQM